MSKMDPEYNHRSIAKWLELANDGTVALPTYQRSYVWDHQKICNYLKALFDNRPTGIFLVLKAEDHLKFKSRTLRGISADPEKAKELILDGQQRITSLWNALKGKTQRVFFVEVKDLRARDMDVVKVRSYSPNSKDGKHYSKQSNAYKCNLIPVSLLSDGSKVDEKQAGQDRYAPGRIWDWSKKASNGDSDEIMMLHNAIKALSTDLLNNRFLYHCALPSDTETSVAIQVFVDTNQTLARINKFDIAVATAQNEFDINLRKTVGDLRDKGDIFKYYFNDDDDEIFLQDFGEWMLKVACLRVRTPKFPNGVIPSKTNYEFALREIFKNGKNCGVAQLGSLQVDLDAALHLAAQHGGATKATLPSWPPIHVIAALQEDLRAIQTPVAFRGTANKLLSAYLWRSFLTNRYELQANQRLHEDFVGLRACLGRIKSTGKSGQLPKIFSKHDLPNLKDLGASVPWIASGRLGRAVAAIVMCKNPTDWVTRDILDVATVRKLQNSRKLDRHHVFSKGHFSELVGKSMLDHGLNGVIISKGGNITLGRKPPNIYLKKVLHQSEGLNESELEQRVESHLVPYDVLMKPREPRSWYREFLKRRADLVSGEMKRLANL